MIIPRVAIALVEGKTQTFSLSHVYHRSEIVVTGVYLALRLLWGTLGQRCGVLRRAGNCFA